MFWETGVGQMLLGIFKRNYNNYGQYLLYNEPYQELRLQNFANLLVFSQRNISSQNRIAAASTFWLKQKLTTKMLLPSLLLSTATEYAVHTISTCAIHLTKRSFNLPLVKQRTRKNSKRPTRILWNRSWWISSLK